MLRVAATCTVQAVILRRFKPIPGHQGGSADASRCKRPMSARPRLSVGLPVYNGQRYLADAIDSLLSQSFEDFELIISDNASNDSTADICQRYARQDSRVRYIRQTRNIGLSPNHNFVVDESRGEFFKWAACDDLYGRDLLLRCVEALDAYPHVVLAHSWTAAIDDAGNVTQAYKYPLATDSPSAPERLRSFLFGSSGLFESSKTGSRRLVRMDNNGILRACDEYGVIRTDVLRKVGPHDSYHHEDRIVVGELLLHGPFYETPDWLYFRRDHEGRAYKSKLRDRCAILDPRRANRLRHPTARLMAEYLWGYVAAIRRAPLSPEDRSACYRELTHWIADRAVSSVLPRHLEPLDEHLSDANVNFADTVFALATGPDR
jgi:glycosyltransferase involved in cell wall biosynthesis